MSTSAPDRPPLTPASPGRGERGRDIDPRCRRSSVPAGRRNRNDIPRRVIVDTLILAGLRVSELCGVDAAHVDIAGARMRVPRSATKTDAGERIVPTVPALRERLAEHRMDHPGDQARPAFPTRNGTRQEPDNVRARILAPILRRANELLEANGALPIAHLTPHILRRTFASPLAVCDVSPRRAMYLLGHTDPKLTLAVYQQVLDMGRGSVAILEQTLGCTRADARAIFNGEASGRGFGTKAEPDTKKPPPQATRARGGFRNQPMCRQFPESG
jgi:integrase